MKKNEFSIRTYFDTGSEFVEALEFEGPLKNTFYVSGYISLDIDGVNLSNALHADYVDQLWSYLVTGMMSISNGEDFKCYFPDQPIPIRFERQGRGRVKMTIDEKSVTVNQNELFTALGIEAKAFFEKMATLDPQHRQDWLDLSKKVDEEFLGG
ncbi:MAG: hypothetical protein AAF456_20640 [Planctomycetota bacterium]